MASPTNILQIVQTYQPSSLAYLTNSSCFIEIANTKFENFNDQFESNLGDTVKYQLPYKFVDGVGLVAQFQGIQQRLGTLTCDQAANIGIQLTAQQRIFNMDRPGDSQLGMMFKSAALRLGSRVDSNIALNAVSRVPVMTVDNDGQSVPTGAYHTESGPYRFYGDGVTPINSFPALAQAIANANSFGAADGEKLKIVLPLNIVPSIIQTGLNQFALDRNNDIAMSWKLGEWGGATFYTSNQLPTYVAGNVGNTAASGNVLTVVSTNDPTGASITQLTLSGATASDANAIFGGDLAQFKDGVTNRDNVRLRTYGGPTFTGRAMQIRVTANAAADVSGNVVVNIYPPLCSQAGNQNQNINVNIVAGMKLTFAPSHVAGLIVVGNGLFIAMPKLPNEDPFTTANEYDDVLKVSMRMYWGSLFGQNKRGMVTDVIWGSSLHPDYCERLLFPLNQTVS